MLPAGVASHLGSVSHKTLKRSSRNDPALEEHFETAWQLSLEEEESRMAQSWLERHLLPLEMQRGYGLKKGQCRAILECIAPTEIASDAAPFPRQGKRGHEVWLSTKDGRVGGYVDAIVKGGNGEVIIDYKSGKIFDDAIDGSEKILNEYDVLQVKLYAALYYCNREVWPQSIRLTSFDSSFVDVPFTAEECLLLLVESYQFLIDVNKIIGELAPDTSAIMHSLSTPSARNCLRCLYRPCCAPYWTARAARPTEAWPFDFYGEPLEIKELGNKSLIVKLRQKNEQSQIVSIRGLTPDRHPGLKVMGKCMGFFSVVPDVAPNAYHEGLLTTVYSVK
jgi:hypothetical protein